MTFIFREVLRESAGNLPDDKETFFVSHEVGHQSTQSSAHATTGIMSAKTDFGGLDAIKEFDPATIKKFRLRVTWGQ